MSGFNVRKRIFVCFLFVSSMAFAAPCSAGWENPVRLSGEGSFWVTWTQAPATGAGADIFCARFDGSKWLDPERVSDRDGTDMSPSVALGADSMPVVVWSGSAEGDGAAIFASTRSPDGTWSPAVQVDTADAEYDTTPAVSALADGSVGVVWAGVENGDDEIWFSSSADGAGWTGAVMLSGDDAYPDVSPVICVAPTGQTIVVWSAFDGASYRLAFCVFDPKTGLWSREAPLTPALSALAQEMPFFSRSADGSPKVFWKEGQMCFSSEWKDGAWSEPESVDFTDDFHSLLSSRRFPAECGGRAWIAWADESGAAVSARLSDMFSPVAGLPGAAGMVPAVVGLDSGLDVLAAFMGCPAAYAEVVDASKIVGFGDSITEGWDGQTYESRLSSILGRAVVNAGVGGERTSRGINRITGVLSDNKAGSILILEGTNDCGDGRSPDTIAYNLGLMVDYSRAAGTTPYVSTIMPRNDIYNSRVEDANVKIKEMISNKSVRMADQHAAFAGRDLTTVYADARLHPNAAGFDIMASVWASLFSSSGGGGGGGGCGRVCTGDGRQGGPLGINFFWLILVGLWLCSGAMRGQRR